MTTKSADTVPGEGHTKGLSEQTTSGGFYRRCSADTTGAEWAEGVGYHVYDEQARIEGQVEVAQFAARYRAEPIPRLPTRHEAAKAAQVLLRCNGHDLDVWTDGEWPVDADDFLRLLAKAQP